MNDRETELHQDLAIVATWNLKILQVLEHDFGATGSGIISLAKSIEDKLPPSVFRHLKRIGRTRNSVAKKGRTLAEEEMTRDNFNWRCRTIMEDLQWLSDQKLTPVDAGDSTNPSIEPSKATPKRRPNLVGDEQARSAVMEVRIPVTTFNPDKIDVELIMGCLENIEEVLPALKGPPLHPLIAEPDNDKWLEYPNSFMSNLMALLESALILIHKLRILIVHQSIIHDGIYFDLENPDFTGQ